MKFPRSSGVLLHITSLPGGDGVGDLGATAYQFVDFLSASGQSIWQILPLSPPAEGNSPYSAYSAFAGNPLMISLAGLVSDGLLDQADLNETRQLTPPDLGPDPASHYDSESVSSGGAATAVSAPVAQQSHVDFATAAFRKEAALSRAFERFQNTASHPLRSPLLTFCKKHAAWLEDFSRFEAIMRELNESDWSKWPAELIAREPAALVKWDDQLTDAIHYSNFKQFLFERQWQALKQYAHDAGVQICGDMPIFVAHESADVWANQSLFAVDSNGKPTLVAGVPPDYFSKTGQLWGNPQYNWDALEKTHYRWWTERFGAAMRQFDLLRVDHFRGFEAYWEVPASARTAIGGKWKIGPGSKPFDAAREVLGELPFIAEDLGLITEEVHQLREQLGFPGMRVLQFGFDTLEDDFHRPSTYPEDSVAYTGTHDNDTLVGWLKSRKPKSPDPLETWIEDHQYAEGEPVHWQLINAVLQSASETAIIPMQDLLGLDNAARMNVPGQAKGNWTWRMSESALTPALTERLKEMTARANRS
ncbi:4-alpha-glucanotransferase [Aporhodopirellula aestuarii]|uniref:4-alpha-glucanotransferase n=1 Tax=Aporhodopirellula aestuarii TaxID=2950107 RepID=A0ABT0U358_9BACT|nr:4-alpha-glucanotransferase [Aporhodopirellula aestuarii]MCM2371307.1 4-alpha-glucanotransferase [Aporhodopirellula aestuarii]